MLPALTAVCAGIQCRASVLPAAARNCESVPRPARTYHPTLHTEPDSPVSGEACGMGRRGQG